MYGNRFYNQLTRKYVALFGTLFNDIKIGRAKTDGELDFYFDVPVNYGPMQKFLARTIQDPDFSAPALTLPRMSFEISNMAYDPTRKLTNSIQRTIASEDTNTVYAQFTPAPYNLDFELNIMTKYNEDGTKILEQIIPFFKPEQVLSVELLENSEMYFDIPVILNSVQHSDDYEGDFQTRRALIWTLNFTVKGYFFGPSIEKKVVKFSRTRVFDDLEATMDYDLIPGGIVPDVPLEKTYSVYMNAFIDELGEIRYGISNAELSTDAYHDNDADNLATTPFVLNEILPELTMYEGDTLNFINEATQQVVITTSPYVGTDIQYDPANLVSLDLVTGMPTAEGSTMTFTPTTEGAYYYMSPDAPDLAGIITVIASENRPIIVDADAGDAADGDANTAPVEETFSSSDRETFTNRGDLPVMTVDSRPGMTIEGTPTDDINETINLSEIDWDDNWGIIVDIKDETEFEPLGTRGPDEL